MSQKNINYSNPDDGLGDKLRNAFIKVDYNFTELFNGKVDKIAGKGLSENDFTDSDKSKLDGIEAGAQVNVNSDFGENDPSAPGYILNRPPSMYASVGYFDHNDTATQTTPLVLVSGILKKLTNNALGAFTDLSQAPYGVPNVWNATNNQFDFSDLSIGDTVDLRVDALLTTTGTNKTYKIYLKLGVDTPFEFTTLVGSGELKTAVTDENIVHEVSFYIGKEYVRDAPAELYLLLDTSGSVEVNGWYTRVIRKGLNVIDITTGALLKDPTTYSSATLPLTGTEVTLLNDGTNWVKITWNNIKAQLASVFQAILVSGTNIKTINGTSILGSGNLVVSGGGGDTIIDLYWGFATHITTTERVSIANHPLGVNTNVTKSGSLLTGPYNMDTVNVIKTSTVKRLVYRFFPDTNDTVFVLRIYAFKQNKDSTSIYDCRLLLEKTLTSGSIYTVQKYNFVTADFLDSNMIGGEFLAFTMVKPGANSFQIKSQNLTIIY